MHASAESPTALMQPGNQSWNVVTFHFLVNYLNYSRNWDLQSSIRIVAQKMDVGEAVSIKKWFFPVIQFCSVNIF